MLEITIQLAEDDITTLKVNQQFAVSADTTFLSFMNTTFTQGKASDRFLNFCQMYQPEGLCVTM